MSSITGLSVAAIEQELKGLTTKKLLAEFSRCIGNATEGYVRASVCYKVLDNRGVKVPGVNRTGAATFLGIASGRIDPIVFRQFLMSPVRQYIEQIPVTAQRELAANPVVAVVEAKPEGGFETKPIDIRDLRTKSEAKAFASKALGSNGVLSIEEQVKRAEAEMKSALESNSRGVSQDDPDRLYRYVRVPLSNKDYNAIKLKADRQGTTEGDVLYRYALMSGAFSEEAKKTRRPRASVATSARP